MNKSSKSETAPEGGWVPRLVRLGVPLLLLVILIEIIWFSCITLWK